MRSIAVIPAFQAANTLPGVLEAVSPYVDGIVVVDDGSSDLTTDVAKHPKAFALRHAINRGQGAALRTGTAAALELGADIVIHVDADGQHDPSYIPSILAPIQNNEADIVIGSRFLGVPTEGAPLQRRILHRLIRQFNRWILGIPANITDPQCGFRAMSAAAAKGVRFHQDRYAHASEILRIVTRSSWRWREVPVRVIYSQESLRQGQKSTDAIKIVWQLVIGAFHH